MDTNFFGLTEKALKLCEDRGVLLASNIVNSSTPNYKARDFDFQKAMQSAHDNATTLKTTSAQHIANSANSAGAKTMYRIPMQESMDGNTVDDEIERKNFIANSLRYQVNLTFLHNASSEMQKAIKGE